MNRVVNGVENEMVGTETKLFLYTTDSLHSQNKIHTYKNAVDCLSALSAC